MSRKFWILIGGFGLFPIMIYGNTPQITPTDVFNQVAKVHQEIASLRIAIGSPENKRPSLLVIANAKPREVFFQAITLYNKINQLSFEITKNKSHGIDFNQKNIQPKDVKAIIDQTVQQLRHIQKIWKIPLQAPPPQQEFDKTPTDVFRSILLASEQLNLMLQRQFMPSDVFQQVTLSLNYTSTLLSSFALESHTPEKILFESNKTPREVYQKLLQCFQIIQGIFRNSQLPVMDLDILNLEQYLVRPSDVFDLATVIVAELAYLHRTKGNLSPPLGLYYPGVKFPSHVYQRARMLERLLVQLEKKTVAQPDWLFQER